MDPWIDRAEQVEGAGLHALIIGVSDYQFLPGPREFPRDNRETLGLTKVNIPARSAFYIARWLRDEYWHPGVQLKTIRLLLSPSQDELADPELAGAVGVIPRATTENVWKAMQAWKAQCQGGHPDDIAMLYVSGHGIQWGSKDDAIVLLEDFSRDELFINQTIDVGRTLKGMSGSDMPQIQMYFVDACRIQPDNLGKYEYAGTGLRLRSQFTGEDLRAAPIFYASCPQTAAKGNRASGTYFAEALVDCLKLHAMVGPAPTSSLTVAQAYWNVNVASLLASLQDRIAAIAARDKEKQEVVMGGQPRPAVFCASNGPPNIPFILHVDPELAAQVAHAELWNSDKTVIVRARAACAPPPLQLSVPAGIYILEIRADPPFSARTQALVAQIPQWNDRITLR